MNRVKVGVLGCGKISERYIKNINEKFQDILQIVSFADMNHEAALAAAEKCCGSNVCTYDEMLADANVEVVLNLTNNWAHFDTTLMALKAGKHVYSEKTMAVDREEAKILVDTARSNGLLLASAPDTFMGGGMQTVRSIVERGEIGKVAYANVFIGMKVESQMFYEKRHGGILFDMGTYFLTALVNLFGPVKRVSGIVKPKFEGEIPQTTTSALEFECGVVANLTTCNESHSYLPKFEIYGSKGFISANDPNFFFGDIVLQKNDLESEIIQSEFCYQDNSRGLGLVEIACVLREQKGRDLRASGELACHVVDVLQSIWDSNDTGKTIEVKYSCNQPAAMPKNGDLGWVK